MATTLQYENLSFYNNINIISTKHFPVSFSLHWHKYIEIAALPLNANIEHPPIIRINQITYTMQPGDLLLIWPGELHEIMDNKDRLLIGLQFSNTLFNDLPDFVPYLNLFRTFHHIRQKDAPELSKNLLLHINNMLFIQENEPNFISVKTLIQLYEMFISFALHLNNTVLNKTASSLHSPNSSLAKINLACNYISENCHLPLSLNTVADYIGFSTCYFSRLFKHLTACSFVEYLTQQRIKRAQILLSDSDINITEIAFQSGFKSISTFNRVFLQYRGCSPSSYRRYYST